MVIHLRLDFALSLDTLKTHYAQQWNIWNSKAKRTSQTRAYISLLIFGNQTVIIVAEKGSL